MRIREYSIETKKLNTDLKICLISDLHSRGYKKCLNAIKSVGADLIICAGDMLERLDGYRDEENTQGFEFLSLVSKLVPTYYAFGNHERFGSHKEAKKRAVGAVEVTLENSKKLDDTGVTVVNEIYCEYLKNNTKILIGGLMSADDTRNEVPNIKFAEEFSKQNGYKILISHQPEYYDNYLRNYDLDLIVSGHTHGGQWKLFGRGVYAPNQGLFPKYFSGLYDAKLIVSAGASNPEKFIPRIFNPCEIVIINIKSV